MIEILKWNKANYTEAGSILLGSARLENPLYVEYYPSIRTPETKLIDGVLFEEKKILEIGGSKFVGSSALCVQGYSLTKDHWANQVTINVKKVDAETEWEIIDIVVVPNPLP